MTADEQPITSESSAAANGELLPVTTAPAERNPALIYLASLSVGSQRAMRHALGVIACLLTGREPALTAKQERDALAVTLPWGDLSAQHAAAVRTALAARYHFKTANKILTALRRVLEHARLLARQAAQDAQAQAATTAETVKIAADAHDRQDALAAAIRAAEQVAGEDTTTQAERGRAVTYGEFLALMSVCVDDPSPAGVRDAALLGLFRVGGLRRTEMTDLHLADYDRVAQSLTVPGKRHQTRSIPVADPGAQDALADWLHLRGLEPGPLFTRIDRAAGGQYTVTPYQLTDQAIYYIVAERCKEAGVAPFMPQDLRRSFAGDLLDAGVALVTVQQLMGHSNPATTAGYGRRGEQTQRVAVQHLHVPYRRRYYMDNDGGASE